MSIKFTKIEPAKDKRRNNPAIILISKKVKITKVAAKIVNGKNKIIKSIRNDIYLEPIGHQEQKNKKARKQEIKESKNPASARLQRGKQEIKKLRNFLQKGSFIASTENKKNRESNNSKIRKKTDWCILNDDNGEDFALKNLKILPPKNLEEIADIAVMGLPEAGKTENWNFIKIKYDEAHDKKATAREHKYILDDFGGIGEIKNGEKKIFPTVIEYAASPYVINLKQKDEKKEISKKYALSLKNSGIIKNLRAALDKITSVAGVKNKFQIPARFSATSHPNSAMLAARRASVKSPLPLFAKEREFRNKLAAFKGNFCFEKKMLLPVLNFAVMASLIILPVYGFRGYTNAKKAQGRVLGAANEALNNFNAGGSLLISKDLNNAKGRFDEAGNCFQDAKDALDEINTISYNLAAVVFDKDKELRSAGELIEAGKKAVEIGSLFFDRLKGEIISSEEHSFGADKSFISALEKFNNVLEAANPKINDLQNSLAEVDENVLPDEYKNQFKKIKDLISFVKIRMDGYAKASDVLLQLTAENSFKRYLLIFQNNNEIRPTGGFIGSYSLVDIKDGKIVNIETPEQGSYYLQGGLLENIKPPRPLTLLNSRWEFQDANWWPDFPQSAKFISDIYEKSGGRTVDGVIAINAKLMENILKVTGPIEMKDYNKIIDSENFISEMQKAVELEYDKNENKPKKIISDLMPKVLEKLFQSNNEKFIDILSIFSKALRIRDIQLFTADSGLESKIIGLGWGGEIKDVKNRDYLYIVDTNLGGRKTDGVIEQSINHKTSIAQNGEIIDELFITKKHNGIKGDQFQGVNNVDYLRIYVPQGAVLLEAEGFNPPPAEYFKELAENIINDSFAANIENREKVDIESGTVIGESFEKTYFANWTQVNPGKEITVRLKYKLPFNVMDSDNLGKYSIFIQKQAGSRGYLMKKNLYYPDSLKTAWSYPGNPDGKTGEWINFDLVEEDKFYGAIFTN